MAEKIPYQLSRAAMRDRYGSRAITSGGQSAQDTTPSGRAAYLAQKGKTPVEAEAQVQNEFKANFQPLAPVAANPPLMTRATRQAPNTRPMFQGGLASPEDVGMVRQMGGTGTLQTPYGSVTLGLLPETAPVEQMAPFLPPTASPLTNFSLPGRNPPRPTYLGSVINNTSRFNYGRRV